MLEVRVLGQFELRCDGEVVLLPSRPAQSLLAYLALGAGTAHRREKLAGLLWPDADEDNARKSLRHALWRIRKVIETNQDSAPYLLTDELAVSFNAGADYWFDAAALVREGDALQDQIESIAVYKGELLPGFYDDWVTLERDRLEALFQLKMQRLLQRLVEERRWPQVLEWGERWVALGHAPEPGYRALMRAHSELGDRARVAQVFRRCREALFNELGVQPSLPTRRLYERLSQEGNDAQPAELPAITNDHNDEPAPGPPPYQGLPYFDEADADRFFGRERLVARLAERLRGEPFLALVGASGSGKSSVIRAGLVPLLRRAGVWTPGPTEGIDVCVLTPTAHPLEMLTRSLCGDSAFAGQVLEELWRDARGLRRFIDQRTRGLVLVVDQFEELFTLCHDTFEREAFTENLLTVVQSADSTRVVITLRADFYAHCAEYPPLREAVAAHQEYLGRLNTFELRQVIEAPAAQGNWELEPGLVDLLLRDVGDEPGALPLVSHALLETWRHRRGRLLTLASYTASGGVHGAIAQTAERLFTEQLTQQQQAIARRLLLDLTELGEGTQDTRRRTSLLQVVGENEDAELRRVLSSLADARLVTLGDDSVEVAHEALIREWPRLRQWLAEDRAQMRLQRQLDHAAQEWERLGRDTGALYRGARLTQALEWVNAHEGELSALSRAFLETSSSMAELDAMQREHQRQRELEALQALANSEGKTAATLRQRAVLLGAALLVALAMAGFALFSADQARQNAFDAQANAARAETESRIASSRELAAGAIANLDIDPERSLLLATQAANLTSGADRTETVEATNALHRAIFSSRAELTIVPAAGRIWGVGVSPDGGRIATANGDHTVRIWDASTGAELLTLIGHAADVNGVAFSPEGSRVATASDDQTVKIWDVATGHQLMTLSTGQAVRVRFSPDGSRLAVATSVPTVWDLNTGHQLFSLVGHHDGVFGIAWSPDGSRLATASFDHTARIWDAATGQALLILAGHTDWLFDLNWSSDSKRVATASVDGTARVWEAQTGASLLTFTGHTSIVHSVAFSPDGTRVATGGGDKVRVWDSTSGRELLTLGGHTDLVSDLTFSPDGTRLTTTSLDGTAKIWDVGPAHELLVVPMGGGAAGVLFSPDGARLVTTGQHGPISWSAVDGSQTLQFNGPTASTPDAVTTSPDGRLLAVGSRDGTAVIFDAFDASVVHTSIGHGAGIVGLAFSPDGSHLATASEDQTARLWDVRTGDELLSLSTQPNPLTAIAYSPDGSLVATASTPGLRTTAENLNQPTVIIWDAATGRPRVSVRGNLRVDAIAFSRDGTRLASGQDDGTLKVWAVQSGENVLTIGAHTGPVVGVAFSPDNAELATASRDGVAKVWDAASGKELLSLGGDGSPLSGVAFSPDARVLATGGRFGIRTYSLAMDDLIQLARARLTRSWRPDECEAYLHTNQCPD